MGKVIENFRDELAKLAQAIEILEGTFINESEQTIKVSLEENTYNSLMINLNNFSNDKECIISIGNTKFIFSKK
jgi:hypothetical protein